MTRPIHPTQASAIRDAVARILKGQREESLSFVIAELRHEGFYNLGRGMSDYADLLRSCGLTVVQRPTRGQQYRNFVSLNTERS